MAQFMMIMMGSASAGDWEAYIDKLADSGKLRGGSSLGNGAGVSKANGDAECTAAGYIRLEAADLDEAKALLAGNPLYEAGGLVEILEEIPD